MGKACRYGRVCGLSVDSFKFGCMCVPRVLRVHRRLHARAIFDFVFMELRGKPGFSNRKKQAKPQQQHLPLVPKLFFPSLHCTTCSSFPTSQILSTVFISREQKPPLGIIIIIVFTITAQKSSCVAN